jgi:hypothetical protein
MSHVVKVFERSMSATCPAGRVAPAVDESSARLFQVLDGGVVRFDLRGRGAGGDKDFDLLSPAADNAPEPGRLGLAGLVDEFPEPVLPGGGILE